MNWHHYCRLLTYLGLVVLFFGVALSLGLRTENNFRLLEGNSKDLNQDGFGLSLVRVDSSKRSERIWMTLNHGRHSVQAVSASIGEFFRHKGSHFFILEREMAPFQGATLFVRKKGEDHKKRLAAIRIGQKVTIDQTAFEVLELDSKNPETGPAAKLRYKDEEFWIFQKHKSFGSSSQLDRGYFFELESIHSLSWVSLRQVRDPGAYWILIGLLIFLLGFLLGAGIHRRTLWYIWKPEEITIVGWSPRMVLFYPDFMKRVVELSSLVGTNKKKSSWKNLEVWRGSI